MGSVSNISAARGAKLARTVRQQIAEAGIRLERPSLDWNDSGLGSIEDLYVGDDVPQDFLEEMSELFDLPLTRGAKRPSAIVTPIRTPRTPR